MDEHPAFTDILVSCTCSTWAWSWGKSHSCGKTSCLVPVPKTPHRKDRNSYRLVALTSHLIKTFEILVLGWLREPVNAVCLQAYLLHRSLSHLEKTGSSVRVMFYDFSSAFNTIQPTLLKDKLEYAGVRWSRSSPGLPWTTSPTDHSSWGLRTVSLTRWSAARGSTRNSIGTLPFYSLYCRLHLQHLRLLPPEVLWWLGHRWSHL